MITVELAFFVLFRAWLFDNKARRALPLPTDMMRGTREQSFVGFVPSCGC